MRVVEREKSLEEMQFCKKSEEKTSGDGLNFSENETYLIYICN